jgi:hypothetical protein
MIRKELLDIQEGRVADKFDFTRIINWFLQLFINFNITVLFIYVQVVRK